MNTGSDTLNESYREAPSWLERQKQAVFEYFFTLQKPGQYKKYLPFPVYVLKFVIQVMQGLSLLFNRTMPPENWGTYDSVWLSVKCIRFDYFLVYDLGLQTISFALAAAFSVSILCSLVFSYKQCKTNFTVIIMGIASGIFQIPIFCLMASSLFFLQPRYSEEYDREITSDYLICIMNVLVFIFQSLFIYAYQCLFIDIRHSSSNPCAKSTGNLDFLGSFTNLVTVVSHFFLLKDRPLVFYAITITMYSGLFIKSVAFLPYYSNSMNLLFSGNFLLMVSSSVFFVIGIELNDAGLIVLNIILVSPLLLFILSYYISKRTEHFRKMSLSKNITVNNYHLLLRLNRNNCKNIRNYYEKMKNNPEIRNEKMLHIWESYFLSSKSNAIARMILAKAAAIQNSFSVDYQFFLCLRWLEDRSTNEEFTYLKFASRFMNIKQVDIESTTDLIKFWKKFIQNNLPTDILFKMIEGIVQDVKVVKAEYKSLLRIDSKNSELMANYGSLLSELLNKIEKGQKFVSKAINIAGNKRELTNLSPFNPRNGVLLIECTFEGASFIKYANLRAHSILKYPDNLLLEKSLEELVPFVLRKSHPGHIKRFFLKMKDQLMIPQTFFLQTYLEHIILLSIKIKLEIFQHKPFFVATFNKISHQHDAFVMNKDRIILGHTKEFCKKAGLSKTISGKHFSEVFKDLPDLMEKTYTYVKLNMRFALYTTCYIFGHSTLFVVYLKRHGTKSVALQDACCPFDLDSYFSNSDMPDPEHEEDEPKDYCIAYASEEEEVESSVEERTSQLKLINGKTLSNCQSSVTMQEKLFYIKKLRHNINHSISGIKLSIALIFGLLLVNGISMIVFSTHYRNKLDLKLNALYSFQDCLYAISSCSLLARMTDLKHRGYLVNIEEDLIRDKVTESLGILETSHNYLMQNEFLNDLSQTRVNNIPVWHDETVEITNAEEFLIEFIRHMTSLTSKFEEISLEDSSLKYIYINGYASAFEHFNQTEQVIIDELNVKIDELFLIFYTSCSLAGTILVGIFIYSLRKVKISEKVLRLLFKHLCDINEEKVRSNCNVLRDRLFRFNKFEREFEESFKKPPAVKNSGWLSLKFVSLINLTISVFFPVIVYLSIANLRDILRNNEQLSIALNNHSCYAIRLFEFTPEILLLDSELSIYNTLPVSVFAVRPEFDKDIQSLRHFTHKLRSLFLNQISGKYGTLYSALFERRNSSVREGKLGILGQSQHYMNEAISVTYEAQAVDKLFEIGIDLWETVASLKNDNSKQVLEEIRPNITNSALFFAMCFVLCLLFFLLIFNPVLKKKSTSLLKLHTFLKMNNMF